jgi:type II restriction/modification system DNA methylase subunit YeeA
MRPLRHEWEETRAVVDALLTTGSKKPGAAPKSPLSPARLKKARGEADRLLHRFFERLARVTVLDPACGSGNFLYIALGKLKELEKEVIVHGLDCGFTGFLPAVGPWQLCGLEINPFAHDLAQTAVWIGYLQWTRANGFQVPQNPVLRPMEKNFRLMDSILAPAAEPGAPPRDPEWPEAEFIVGNPPFLGGKIMRTELGDEYVDRLFECWKGRVAAESDLCCYWFEKARAQIESGKSKRVGLLATQGIRGGANRTVLERIKKSGGIFFAVADREWILDGANVHISMVGFDDGAESERTLDGQAVASIHANLTASSADLTRAARLPANRNIAFMGSTKGGAFDIDEETALEWLAAPNPHGRPNSDVLFPWINGLDVTRRPRRMWIIDFGKDRTEAEAALFEAPFAHVREHVLPKREKNKRESYRRLWWRSQFEPEPVADVVDPHCVGKLGEEHCRQMA